MKILVDADACPVTRIVEHTAKKENIEVEYMDMNWKKQKIKLSGWTAQICQHEFDHLSGRII